MVLLSPEEKIFIVHGAEQNIRNDGREQLQYRRIDVETGIIPSCMGSTRIILGKTDLIACVSANICTPKRHRPNEGELELYIHFSAVASPYFEGKRGEQKSDQISALFNKLYSNVRLNFLCIEPNEKCWKINVDVSVVSIDGNLYDAVSLAVKAALATTNIPNIKISSEDKGKKEFQISDDPLDTWVPDVTNIPCLVTITKIGDAFIVDPTSHEEQCSTYRSIVAVTEDKSILATLKVGPGSLQPNTFMAAVNQAVDVGAILNANLNEILQKEANIKNRRIHGFLT